MKFYALPGEERPVDAYGSKGAMFSGITRHDGRIQFSSFRIEPEGVVGRHPAAVSQLFLVVDGEGWVSGPDGQHYAIRTGQAAFWEPGESHESGSRSGMTVLLVEGEELVIEMQELASL